MPGPLCGWKDYVSEMALLGIKPATFQPTAPWHASCQCVDHLQILGKAVIEDCCCLGCDSL
jgi:hypothetical protein